eukprot:CAMPEP_0181308926 /NCGR_PEP_ID=MMETSP1101-20121128/11740_1 /TAXON_ID=46948 /ORGANISM="Rhodomonas abbreviata, Strain Caron Lab Isolate" /LENGTH=236 /DNA_ID=CAMNT_0023415375 /DNA_START=103 /DNA_END=813 /DNA_ORIENTATION=+
MAQGIPPGQSSKSDKVDPYRIGSRFISKQARIFPQALKEIQGGRKSSHWMWYIIPTPPYAPGGVERGSGTNREWALRDLPPNDLKGNDAARAFLYYPEEGGVNLRKNYYEIITAVGDQLEQGNDPVSLMGYLDDPKLRSSVRLFEFVTREDAEMEDVHAACLRVLTLLKEDVMPPAASKSKAAPAGKVVEGKEEEQGTEEALEKEAGATVDGGVSSALAEKMEELRVEAGRKGKEL